MIDNDVMKERETQKYIENLKTLHDLLIGDYKSFNELVDAMLDEGREVFDCSSGIISRIDGEEYLVWAV